MANRTALSFDRAAVQYDEFRTGYAPQLVSDLVRHAKLGRRSLACEIGAGTGQASEQIASIGCELFCIEPGVEMGRLLARKVARFSKTSVLTSTFEEAKLPPRRFDLVFAAQSLHWINIKERYKKPHMLLKNGGTFAAFWKRTDPTFWDHCRGLKAILVRHLGEFSPPSYHESEAEAISWLGELAKSGLFRFCELRRYQAPASRLVPKQFIGNLGTSSSILSMPDGRRAALIEEVQSYFRKSDRSKLRCKGETVLILGSKCCE